MFLKRVQISVELSQMQAAQIMSAQSKSGKINVVLNRPLQRTRIRMCTHVRHVHNKKI